MSSTTLFYISVVAMIAWLMAMKFKVHLMVFILLGMQLFVAYALWKHNVMENFASEPQDGDIILNLTDILRSVQPYFTRLKDMVTYRKSEPVSSSISS